MQKPVGAQKAAIILMSLGEEVSAQILKGLSTDEIKKLGAEMTNITGVKKELCDELLLEFTAQFNEDADIHTPGDDFLMS
jgi:flagellar motor switch protein FliG